MLTTTSLLTLYRAEKKDMVDDIVDFINFPSFKDWKAEYEQDHKRELPSIPTLTSGMIKNEKPVDKVNKPKDNKSKAIKKKSKATLALDIYKELMALSDGKHPSRQDIIITFMTKLNMSKSGASTYHYNIKQKLS